MADIERWAEWTSTVTRIDRFDSGPLKPGSRATVRQPKLLPAIWKVTAVEPGRGFTWITRGPGVRVTANHFVEPVGSGTRATLSLHFDGPFGGLVAKLTAGLNNRYLAIEAAGLKRRSEFGKDGKDSGTDV
jgi:polyketide cyclase/dehydrase/lipid transport protein